jgi:serine phosphatase RsbU (regulator of sigma subunit)
MQPAPAAEAPPAASFIVVDPGGQRSRVEIHPLPFGIGRSPDSQLIIRDSRASRNHARVVAEGKDYVIEDCGSRHGTHVNGKPIRRHLLRNSDHVEFGVPDSYRLIFAVDGVELKRMIEQFGGADKPQPAGGLGANLAKLRAILDLARTLQSSFSTEDVLKSVVDTALAITGAERGFLMLRDGDELDIRVARNRRGATLDAAELRVPTHLIQRALHHRRELLSMNFDPLAGDDTHPQHSVADLELRSVICVPLVRIRTGQSDVTSLISTESETVGLIYMDSRAVTADMAGGNRELLQTLAIEASTILENARLLEEERVKHKIEEELSLARGIQQSMLPRALPAEGWFRAAGSSLASHAVGGDYFDVTQVHDDCWSVVVADVSGKGVASALLASLLQGALITASDLPSALPERLRRLNHFLNSRTEGEKYATIFYALVESTGRFYYVNAAHCPPLVVRAAGGVAMLEATGMPVGLLDPADFELGEEKLAPGDKVVIYTDGVTEAQSAQGEFFGRKRLKEIALAQSSASCQALHDAIRGAVERFTAGADQADDITLVTLEFGGK